MRSIIALLIAVGVMIFLTIRLFMAFDKLEESSGLYREEDGEATKSDWRLRWEGED